MRRDRFQVGESQADGRCGIKSPIDGAKMNRRPTAKQDQTFARAESQRASEASDPRSFTINSSGWG